MKTNRHSSKFWATLCLMVCLLIGSGIAKADTSERSWTYNPTTETMMHKDNGLVFRISAVDSLLTITG